MSPRRNSKTLLVTLAGISLLFSAGLQPFGQELSAKQKEVWQMEIQYWELLKGKNLKGFEELYHKDYIGWNDWIKKPMDKDGMQREVMKWYDYVDSYTVKPEAINLFVKFAIIYYRFRWSSKSAEWPNISGRMCHFWIKEVGKWQMIGGFYTRE
jgi:hypothetical protein